MCKNLSREKSHTYVFTYAEQGTINQALKNLTKNQPDHKTGWR